MVFVRVVRCTRGLQLGRCPLLSMFNEFVANFGPVVQIGGVEICIVGPDQSSYFGVEAYLVEYRQVPEWAINFTVQDRFEINRLYRIVIELYS